MNLCIRLGIVHIHELRLIFHGTGFTIHRLFLTYRYALSTSPVPLSIYVFMFPKARLLTFHTAGTIKSDHFIRRGRLPLRWRSIAHEIFSWLCIAFVYRPFIIFTSYSHFMPTGRFMVTRFSKAVASGYRNAIVFLCLGSSSSTPTASAELVHVRDLRIELLFHVRASDSEVTLGRMTYRKQGQTFVSHILADTRKETEGETTQIWQRCKDGTACAIFRFRSPLFAPTSQLYK